MEDIFNENITIPDGENLWQEYIKNNSDKEWKAEGEFIELTAQDCIVMHFMFFDTEN